MEGSFHKQYLDAESLRRKSFSNLDYIGAYIERIEDLKLTWNEDNEDLRQLERELEEIESYAALAYDTAVRIRKNTPSSTIDFVESPTHRIHYSEILAQIDEITRQLPAALLEILVTSGAYEDPSKLIGNNYPLFRISGMTEREFNDLDSDRAAHKVYRGIAKLTIKSSKEDMYSLSQEDIERMYRLLKLHSMARDVNSLIES